MVELYVHSHVCLHDINASSIKHRDNYTFASPSKQRRRTFYVRKVTRRHLILFTCGTNLLRNSPSCCTAARDESDNANQQVISCPNGLRPRFTALQLIIAPTTINNETQRGVRGSGRRHCYVTQAGEFVFVLCNEKM
jgi:hypothetical protein